MICSGYIAGSPASLKAWTVMRPAVWWLPWPSRSLPWKRDSSTHGRLVRMTRTTSRITLSLPHLSKASSSRFENP